MQYYKYRIIVLCYLIVCPMTYGISQNYSDYFGAGHTIGLKVSSSSDVSPDSPLYSIDGSDLIVDEVRTARFLSNATLGASFEDIQYVSQIGIKIWIHEQMEMIPDSNYLDIYKKIYSDIVFQQGQIPNLVQQDSVRKQEYLGFAFYEKLFSQDDVLRQRVAFALSQIFVITRSAGFIKNRGFGVSDYYDVLYEGSFGNFRDLLEKITLHPIMGVYLSHFQNEKADTIQGIFPDENYAREIMQLFTIGLFDLNMDGTLKLDPHENPIPAYDIIDVQEMAKVFTGLSGGAYEPISVFYKNNIPLRFDAPSNQYDYTVPMVMWDDYHDHGPKVLMTGDTIPAGQSGDQDINDALDILFNHPNTAPFIAKRLIQHMVKSNPNPSYVKRVALSFEDNGTGVRGDLKAVITAILTDPEAIDCDNPLDSNQGKLIQPLERFLNLFLAFDLVTPSGKYYFRDINQLQDKVEQSFLNAPSVFNFFTPFFAETKYIDPSGLVSPEFQIFHSISSIHYLNLVENSLKRQPFNNFSLIHPNTGLLTNNPDDRPILLLNDELDIYINQGIEALLDRLSLVLCRGQLSQNTKDLIAGTIASYESNIGSYTYENALEDALYFIMASPDYIIQK